MAESGGVIPPMKKRWNNLHLSMRGLTPTVFLGFLFFLCFYFGKVIHGPTLFVTINRAPRKANQPPLGPARVIYISAPHRAQHTIHNAASRNSSKDAHAVPADEHPSGPRSCRRLGAAPINTDQTLTYLKKERRDLRLSAQIIYISTGPYQNTRQRLPRRFQHNWSTCDSINSIIAYAACL